ncbi:MAG: hypothetical protein LLG04_13125 [Parachlamydia sp.]|nr:hypothetical protein [Parachlamydia sp.]
MQAVALRSNRDQMSRQAVASPQPPFPAKVRGIQQAALKVFTRISGINFQARSKEPAVIKSPTSETSTTNRLTEKRKKEVEHNRAFSAIKINFFLSFMRQNS